MNKPLQITELLQILTSSENGSGYSPAVVYTIVILWALSLFLFPHLKKIPEIISKQKDEKIEDQGAALLKLKKEFEELKLECDKTKLDLQTKLTRLEVKEARTIGALEILAPQLLKLDIDIRPQLEILLNATE